MQRIIAGIDLGYDRIKVSVINVDEENKKLHNAAQASIKTEGAIKQGTIKDPQILHDRLSSLFFRIKNKKMIEPDEYAISCDGSNITLAYSQAEIPIKNPDKEVTETEIEFLEKRAISRLTETFPGFANYHILTFYRTKTYLDSQEIINNNPEGLVGSKLSGEFVFVLTLKQFISDVINLFEMLGIELDENNFYPAPLVVKQLSIPKDHTIAGCALVDIGADTTKVSVFDEDNLIAYHSIPIGSVYITKELAKSLGVHIAEAEQIKRGTLSNSSFSASAVKKTVERTYKEIFKQVNTYLKQNELLDSLAGGIILSGGGSVNEYLINPAKSIFKVPVHTYDSYIKDEPIKKLAHAGLLPAYGSAYVHYLQNKDSSASNGILNRLFKKLTSFLP